jgi:serine phosphatase RsbU (regulator of sigma subunit)
MVLGDVSGKGMPASLMMMSLHSRVRAMLEEPAELASAIAKLNRVTAANCPPGKFITFFAAMLDPGNGDLAYCNAGHNPPIIARAGGNLQTLEDGGVPIGLMPAARYKAGRTEIRSGDVLLIYSDGVTDVTNPDEEEFGEERLRALLKAHREQCADRISQALLKALRDWASGSPQPDDVTFIVARRT